MPIVNDLAAFLAIAPTLDFTGGPLSVEVKPARKISRSMQKTWRMWMDETAEHMALAGATMPLVIKDGKPWGNRPFNEKDAHELFVATYLGRGDTGERFSTATGDKGAMVWMMDQHLTWCITKGWELTIPEDGEYMRCRAAQEG